jgi:hypothetical protein
MRFLENCLPKTLKVMDYYHRYYRSFLKPFCQYIVTAISVVIRRLLFSSVTCEFHFANDLKSSIVWVTGTSFTFVNLIFGFGMASINAGSKQHWLLSLITIFRYS